MALDGNQPFVNSFNVKDYCNYLNYHYHNRKSQIYISIVSMENINTDIHELERGMELTKRESITRKDSRDHPVILKDFLANSEEKFKKLLGDVNTAQVSGHCGLKMPQ